MADGDDTENFGSLISEMNRSISEIRDCFEDIGKVDPAELEDRYFKEVGNYGKILRRMLKLYAESDKETRRKFKPYILFYRQLQGYLVFLIRFPDILRVYEHDEIKQTLYFIDNMDTLIKGFYTDLAAQQTELFEGDFREKLDRALELKLKFKHEADFNKN